MSRSTANAQGAEIEAPAGPIAASERLTAVDTLRGVAVLGILVMNIYAFAMPFPAYSNPLLMGGTEWYNLGTWFVTHILFDQKFMTIFSLLFGGGLIIMWERAEARNANFGRIYFRRQFWLLIIGALHGYLIWFGDILFHYAVAGMFVFLFRKAAPRSLIVIALLLLPIAPLLSYGSGIYMSKLGQQADEISAMVEAGDEISEEQQAIVEEWSVLGDFVAPDEETIRSDVEGYLGSYPEIVQHRLPTVISMQTQATLFFVLWRVGGLMLIGMSLMKLGILSGQRDAGFYRRMLLIGYGLGLPVMLYSAYFLAANHWDGIFMFRVGMLPNYIGSILVACGHIAGVMLVVKSQLLRSLVTRFTAVGRMALTNYLLHSIVMTTIFYGYGFGLYGQLPRAAQMLFVIAMLAFQLWLSPLWLDRFRFGPVEWLWRSLTYWRSQPFRQTG